MLLTSVTCITAKEETSTYEKYNEMKEGTSYETPETIQPPTSVLENTEQGDAVYDNSKTGDNTPGNELSDNSADSTSVSSDTVNDDHTDEKIENDNSEEETSNNIITGDNNEDNHNTGDDTNDIDNGDTSNEYADDTSSDTLENDGTTNDEDDSTSNNADNNIDNNEHSSSHSSNQQSNTQEENKENIDDNNYITTEEVNNDTRATSQLEDSMLPSDDNNKNTKFVYSKNPEKQVFNYYFIILGAILIGVLIFWFLITKDEDETQKQDKQTIKKETICYPETPNVLLRYLEK